MTTEQAGSCSFETLGVPVRVRNLSFSAVTQDPEGFHVAWAGFLEPALGRAALVGIRTDTGEVLWNDLSPYGEGKVTLTQGADGNITVYAGSPGHFFRYDIVKRELQDLGVPADPAGYYASGALGPDGAFYVGSYPNATLVRCDTRTGKIENLGRIAPDERQFYIYPSVAVSDDGVVYCPVGLHHMELWTCDTRTGDRRQVLPPALTELQGAPTVWTGADGQVYGKAGDAVFRCLPDRVEMGATAPQRERPPMLAGNQLVGAIDETGVLKLTDVRTGEVTALQTRYEGSRVFVYSVSCERDGRVYGSSLLPGRSFSYDLRTGALTDLGILGSGHCQVYDTISLPEGLFLCSYLGAHVDVYDPDRPVEAGVNPRHLGHVPGQERPIQWCLGHDGMLYSGTEPSKGRLGGTIMRVNPKDMSLRSWPTPIPNQSVEYIAAIPETGELFCTTSIRGGSSAIPTEQAACVFLWDLEQEAMVFRADPVPGTPTYGCAVLARNGLIYGLAGAKYYVFDPRTRTVRRVGDLPVKTLHFPHLNREPVGPKGLLYGMGDDAVFAIDPADDSVRIIVRDPSIGRPGARAAHGFFVTSDGTLYFGSGATLMRCRLPM